jgi:tetratricopeptide (TPR) repeat protein
LDAQQQTRKRRYEEQLRAIPPRGPIYILYGGDPKRALETLIKGEPGSGEHYVYLHRAPNDDVFYVGKGKNNRAFSRDRDPIWHHFVNTRCDGNHHVEIVKRFATEDEALELESDLIALFGENTVNAINTARPIDLKINVRFHELRKANWARIASGAALLGNNPTEAERIFREAIEKMAEYARLNWESTGLFTKLAAELYPHWGCHLNGQDLSALDKLTLLLKTHGRWADLIATVEDFFATYPETVNQGAALRVAKRADAARSKERVD